MRERERERASEREQESEVLDHLLLDIQYICLLYTSECVQRANFPGVIGEIEASSLVNKNKGFLKVFLVDERSTNRSPVYYDFPGKASQKVL